MARGINKVILIGNLGQDPEVKYTASGMAVVNLRLATTDQWRDKQSGETKERTEWHSVVLYGKVAEIAGQYLKKGRQVYIEGRLQTRKWQDKEGKDRYTTEVVCNDMQMIGGPASGGTGNYDRDSGSSSDADAGGGRQNAPERADSPSLEDDDIPF